MRIELPDGSVKECDDGATGADLAAAIGPGLARAALAVKVGDEVRDLARPLADGDRVEIVTERSPEALELIRHDTAHVLAAAVLDLHPGTRISIGPPKSEAKRASALSTRRCLAWLSVLRPVVLNGSEKNACAASEASRTNKVSRTKREPVAVNVPNGCL